MTYRIVTMEKQNFLEALEALIASGQDFPEEMQMHFVTTSFYSREGRSVRTSAHATYEHALVASMRLCFDEDGEPSENCTDCFGGHHQEWVGKYGVANETFITTDGQVKLNMD